jgi:hypothetical protein
MNIALYLVLHSELIMLYNGIEKLSIRKFF